MPIVMGGITVGPPSDEAITMQQTGRVHRRAHVDVWGADREWAESRMGQGRGGAPSGKGAWTGTGGGAAEPGPQATAPPGAQWPTHPRCGVRRG